MQGRPGALKNISRTMRLGAALRRIRTLGPFSLLLGLWLRRSLSTAGVVWVRPGLPFPAIVNKGGRIDVASCGFFPGVRIECWKGARVSIGKGTYLNRNTEIVAAESVTIGMDCKIARDVLIMDTDQHAIGAEPLVNRPVVVEDRVWIGARAIILKGVVIGHDSIVAAGAIVTKSVPPWSVVAGPAARVVRRLSDAADDDDGGA